MNMNCRNWFNCMHCKKEKYFICSKTNQTWDQPSWVMRFCWLTLSLSDVFVQLIFGQNKTSNTYHCNHLIHSFFFYVGTPNRVHLFGHLLWPIFQSSIHFTYYVPERQLNRTDRFNAVTIQIRIIQLLLFIYLFIGRESKRTCMTDGF